MFQFAPSFATGTPCSKPLPVILACYFVFAFSRVFASCIASLAENQAADSSRLSAPGKPDGTTEDDNEMGCLLMDRKIGADFECPTTSGKFKRLEIEHAGPRF